MTYDLGSLSGAKIWPYLPDWSASFELRRAFLTDVITSRDNTEQRRALRDIPRLSASYRTNLGEAELQNAKLFLRGWQNQPVVMPDFARWKRTTASSSAGASTLTMASPPPWISANRAIGLCSNGTIERAIVLSVVGSTITLTGPLALAWPSGSVVRPMLHGLLDGKLQARRFTRGTHALDVSLSVYPGGEPIEIEGDPPLVFNDFEVFSAEADFSGQPSLDHLFPVEQVDMTFGRTAQFRPIDRAQQLTEAQFNGLSPDAAQEIERVFLRAKGSRGRFYRPTCEKDMTPASSPVASTTIDMAGTTLAHFMGSFDYAQNDVAIEIVKTDGTRLHRLINSIVVNAGNSRVTVDSAVTLTPATTARISWMPLVRLASDELATIWKTPLSASIAMTFQTVKQ